MGKRFKCGNFKPIVDAKMELQNMQRIHKKDAEFQVKVIMAIQAIIKFEDFWGWHRPAKRICDECNSKCVNK